MTANPDFWTAQPDDDGSVCIYDRHGFVTSVPDWPTAERLVHIHNACVYGLQNRLQQELNLASAHYHMLRKVTQDLRRATDELNTAQNDLKTWQAVAANAARNAADLSEALSEIAEVDANGNEAVAALRAIARNVLDED